MSWGRILFQDSEINKPKAICSLSLVSESMPSGDLLTEADSGLMGSPPFWEMSNEGRSFWGVAGAWLTIIKWSDFILTRKNDYVSCLNSKSCFCHRLLLGSEAFVADGRPPHVLRPGIVGLRTAHAPPPLLLLRSFALLLTFQVQDSLSDFRVFTNVCK